MPRKGENIYKRKDGRWEARLLVNHLPDGRAVYKSFYGRTYTEVKEKRLAEINNMQLQLKEKRIEISFDTWLSDKKHFIKASTYDKYFSIIKLYLHPYFRNRTFDSLTTNAVQGFVNSMIERGMSASVIRTSVTILKSTITYLCCNSNCDFKQVQIPALNRRIMTLDRESQRKLTEYAIAAPNYANLGVLISLYTGIRIGELCALTWSDIKHESIIITKTIQRLNSQSGSNKTLLCLTEPKSINSVRSIPIPSFLHSIIESMRCDDSCYVVTGIQKPTEPRAFRKKFNTILKRCNIPHTNFHSLRHTFATRCIECGVDVKTLSEILGHSSVRITLDRYVHVSFEQKYENINKLSLVYSPSEK